MGFLAAFRCYCYEKLTEPEMQMEEPEPDLVLSQF